MLTVITAVFDSKVKVYTMPMHVRAVGEAMRGFTDEVNNPQSKTPWYTHAQDFSLYELGSYDDNTAEYIVLKEPKLLCRGIDVQVKV